MNIYLFIYLVARTDAPSLPSGYCSVVAYGHDRQEAEAIAINRVHQDRCHILRADTVAQADWLDDDADGFYLSQLRRYGVALRQMAA